MADEIIRLDYSAEDIGDNIDEVRTARGEYDSLDERLDDIESGSFKPTQAQLAAINSGITDDDVEQIDLNKNNILSVKDHYKYGNRILFEQESIPTGTIAYGSTWIDGKAVRTYNQTTNIVGGVIEQGSWNASNLIKEDSTNRCRLSNSITVQPSTTYTITLNSPTINNARLLLQYRDSNDYTSSESGWQATLPYTFTTPPACHKATIIFSNTGNTTCTPTNFGNLQINEAGSLLFYEVPSWSTSSVDDVKKNEANILLLEQMNGAKNKFNYEAWKNCGVYHGTKTVNGNSFTLVADGGDCYTWYEETAQRQYPINARIPCNAGDKVVLTWDYTPLSSQTNDRVGIFANGLANTGFFALTLASDKKLEFTAPTGTTYLSIRFGVQMSGNSATYGNIQLQTKTSYDAGFTNYQPYALSNAELTDDVSYLENTGKKNWLKPDTISGVPTGITIQYESDDSITINGTYSGSDYAYVFLHSFSYEAMRYTLSCNVETKASTYYFYTRDGHMQTTQTLTYTYSDSGTTQIVMRIAPNASFSNVNVKLMIRPSIITDTTYQPHALSNAELTSNISNCQFIASRADYAEHTFTVKRSNTTGRYHYGIFMVGTPSTYGIYKIFYNDANSPASATVEKILGNSALTYTASITWNGLVGTLTLTGSDRAYGGIRGIWFD